mgnify:CR=1 FL=1
MKIIYSSLSQWGGNLPSKPLGNSAAAAQLRRRARNAPATPNQMGIVTSMVGCKFYRCR